jgi:UDP-N-acetylmuramyl pentapeptide phosphotransferase/UDP-N-acetylglucosamine-1-phosphate transferase
MDWPGAAVQKFHVHPTPRIGGIGIYCALLVGAALIHNSGPARILTIVLVAGMPALTIGLLEDVTKRVAVPMRLAFTVCSGLLACWLSGIEVDRIDLPLIDTVLAVGPLGILFTAFAVGGVANAINIIDGFHGLASGTTTLALTAIAIVAAQVGDTALMLAAVMVAAAVVGFWLINFPWGRLFLGDGGAYFAGFALAWLAVLLPERNPTVSPWASFLICGYPVIEVIYSITRRWLGRQSAGQADCSHLHSLVASRVVKAHLRRLNPTFQNAAVSVVMWMCAAIPTLLGVTFHDQTSWLVPSAIACLLLYHCLYRRLARS